MKNLEILSKNDGAVLEKTTANKIVLNQNSIVKIDASIEEVLNFQKEGNSLVINFKNGEQLVVESYFDDPLNSHNILFNDNGQLYWVEFTDAANEIASTIKYYPIDDISALIAGNSSTALTGLTPWLIAGGLAAGVVAIADNMSDSDKKSNSVSPEPEPPINDELEEAKQLVNDAEKAYQDLKDLIEDKLNDGLITPEEKAELEEALQDAKDAKDAAQDKVDNLVDGEEKSDLQDRLDDLVDEELPPINDQNGDGVPDDLEQALLDAEEAVANAEQAYEALKDLILEKNENGLITPAERAELDQAKEAFESAKALAETKTNLLPESVQSQKDALQERLEDLVDIILPEINDENDDGIVDDIAEALIEAELAVAEAEAKYAAAENALTVANRDGLINPTELNALQNALEQAQIAKSTAQSKVNALPESVQEQKDAFQNRLDDLTDISLPEVNDADGDGIVDGLPEAIQEAQSAVEEAEAKYAEALNNLALAQKDGLINPLELSILEQKVQAALDAKEVAQDKVNVLPNGAIKDGLQDRLDALVNIDLPEVNDADGDGVPDGEDITLEEATEAVEAAEAAYAEAEQALADAESDGLITPTELTELTQARDDALTAKEDAQAKVDALPEGADKDALDARLDDLVDITLPAVNDENEDGVDDAVAALEEATEAVEAAESAYAEAEQALADAESDGLITPTELTELTQARDDALAAKEDAQAKVDALPEGTDKDALDARLDDLVDITLPTVNDEDEDGVVDDIGEALAAAEAAVEAAEAAYAAAEQALIDANANGLITPTELTALTQARDDALAAKTEAQTKVTALPEAVQAEKDALQGRLNDLVDITLPAVNDENEDGVDDAVAALEEATEAVEAAESAYAEAEQALADAESDGLITPTELTELTQARDDALAAKEDAQAKVDALPEGTDKDALDARLDDLVDITLPTVNDEDEDGVVDDIGEALAAAEAAVEAAEAAYAAAEQALIDANANGLITPTELTALTQARDDALAAKTEAQTKVTALPEAVQAEKDALQGRLNDLVDITLPAVNDENEDGVADEYEQVLADAEAAVEAAEAAYAAAEQALIDANANGLITPTELTALTQARDDALAAKTEAQTKVTALPEAVQAEKDALQGRLNDLVDITLPTVNDEDEDGVVDDIGEALAAAEAAVEAAEAAYAAAEQALIDANANGLITPTELTALTQARDDALAAKTEAQTKVTALPEAVQAEKDALQGRLNDLVDITLPTVNDENEDGVDDAVAALEEATEAVEAAEAAYAEAEQALADAESDGLITPTELAELTQARDDALTAKEDAQAKVDALPEGADKDALDARLDDLVDITLPAVNDENEDGVDDAVAALEEATEAVEAAEAAYAEAEQALADAESDGLITPTELTELTQARDDALAAKEDAQAKVDALPEGADKDALDARLDDLVDITLPTVNDENEDGVADEYEQVLADAEAAVEAAEAAYAEAEQALADAESDGLITPTELAELTQARDDALAAKEDAQAKVDALPEGADKDALDARLDDLVDITLPAVNDENEDGVADEYEQVLADAEAAVEAAEAAYAAAEQALIDANANGLITPTELTALTQARDDALAAKTEAQTKVTALPEAVQAEKDALQGRLNDLVDITLPTVNDEDEDGVVDDIGEALAAAEAAVEAAEAAYAAAEQALIDANANGLITPTELTALTQARDDALAAKTEAQTKVTALPEAVQAEKDALQGRLNDLVDITLPTVNDENEDGVDDAVAAVEEATEAVEAAEAAYAEAEQALADAESDGLITPTELAELTQARDDALTAKEDAQAKVDALPEGADKDALDARLDDLVDITLPTVNDENEDGVADEYEQVLADAEAAVEAAEAAYAAAEQALIDANANGLITPTELTALTQARDDALAAKTEAQTKVTALPEAVQAEKDALQGRLNDLVDFTLPTVNDQNENDISDDIDTLLAGVEALIESAEEAYTTAEEDLADALQDGTVTQAEADKLQESLEAAQAAKTLAQQALDNIDQTSDAIEAAKALLQERIDDLVDIEVPEPFATANNDVQLVLDITPTVDVNETPTELNSTGFTVGSVGLGPVLNASVLESVFSSSVSLSVEEGTERDISFYADAGGVTVGTMNLFMYKLNESTGEYELKEKIDNWYLVVLGGVSETISRSLDEGEWLIVLGNGQGLSAVTGYTLRFESDAVRDFNNPEAVTGTINGNVITDQDYQNGTDVVPEGSKISGVTHGEDTINQFTDGIATIKGEYGTLTISENGQYTYTVDPSFRDYGEVDRFVYEVTAPNGEKRTAELNIELVRVATDENAIIDNTVLLDVTPDLTETTGEALGISNAVALNLLDLGIAGDVLSASVIGTEGVMDFTVEDGTFQEMTFTGSAGGVTLLSTFSLVIYRLDENTEQLVQVHEIPNFVQVIIGGGVSTPVTLSFGEGTYVGIIKQTSGVNVIGGASAQVTDVNIYDYANPEMITGSVQGDATPITTDKLILVNNTDVVEGEVLVVQGQYGSLNINTDGTYTYNVTVPQSTVGWTPPYGEIDRFEVVVERADGTTYIEVLNIKIDTNTVANDAEVVDVQAANYSTLNESVESGLIGSASRTLEFKVEEGSYISSLDLQGNITRTLTNDNPSMSVVINKVTTQLVNGVEQQVLEQVYTGNVSITWPAGTILNPSTSTTYASEIILDDGKVLDAGDYVISINTTSSTFNSVNVSSASITGIMVNNITPTDTPLLEGDLFENDTAIDQIDILKIGSKELYVNDPAKGGQEFTVQGKHGVLTVFKDGTYEYQPSGLSGGLETFTYTTVSKAGTSQSATLEINVSMTLTGSEEADTVQASASIDTFTLGEGADTVLYDVLNQAQHTESPDIWTDFNQAEGDRVDISALLKDQNVTSSNIGEFVTIKQDGANTVISVDTDGAKTKYNPTELIVLQNTDSSLYAIDDLLKYNQI